MFKLNGTPLALDTPFTTEDGTQYPANWLRLSSAEEKAAIGITEEPDAPAYDDRFYWAPGVPKALEDKAEIGEDGNPVLDVDGKQLIAKGLKSQFVAQIKATAGAMLAASDWKIVRAAEGIKPVDAETLAARAAIRAASDANEAKVLACKSVDELAAVRMVWPK